MAQGEVARHLEEEAEGHRWNTESVIADCPHRDEPRDHNRYEAGIGKVCVDALHRSEPEESDKEE